MKIRGIINKILQDKPDERLLKAFNEGYQAFQGENHVVSTYKNINQNLINPYLEEGGAFYAWNLGW